MKRKLIILLIVLFIGTVSIANAAYTWPTTSETLSSGYGTREKPNARASSNHKGVDISVSAQPCYAIANGRVVGVYNQGADGYGRYIIIDIGKNIWTLYGHLSEVYVTTGQSVSQGEIVAKSGNTGNSTGPHLHFEVRSGAYDISSYFNSATVLNPVTFLNGATVSNTSTKTASSFININNSASTQLNKCVRCGAVIGDLWYKTEDGIHYKACISNHNHQYYMGKHDYINGQCTVCKIIEEKQTIFTDLSNDHWAYDDVRAMVDAGIVAGKGDGTLGTNDVITAEEMLVLLSQVINKKGIQKSEGVVYIPEGMEQNWSYNLYVELTKALGNSLDRSKKLGENEIKLILGNTDSQVLENYKKTITREKVANILGLFITDGQDTSVNYLNAQDWEEVNSIYKKRINKLVEKGILRGTLNGDGSIYINPNDEIIRVEAIALISRLYRAL